jgi:hypothetical protein
MEFDLSQDPETARQISQLSNHQRPLLVVDVDEVILEFVQPLMRFLAERGYYLKTDSFRLNGNVVFEESGEAASNETVEQLIDGLLADQEKWQRIEFVKRARRDCSVNSHATSVP